MKCGVGGKVGKLKRIIIVGGMGVFGGGVVSKGMMDIGGEGIFDGVKLRFYEMMCIVVGVMVRDVVVVDVFNRLGVGSCRSV